MKFGSYLINERYKNLFTDEDKEKYKDEVYNILKKAYEKVDGGLVGRGFSSPDDMVKNIKMWKLGFTKGKLVAVSMYKDKFGRKLVAFGSIGRSGIMKISEMMREDFKRSYVELSGPALNFIQRNFPDILKEYSIKSIDAVKHLKLMPSEYNIIDKYYYERRIGGSMHKKIMVGTRGKDIITY